jgi:hypothetical protein
LATGTLSWSKAEKISRQATPENESEWIDLARSVGVRELENQKAKPTKEHSSKCPAQGSPTLPKPFPRSKPSAEESETKPRRAVVPKPALEKCHVTFVFTPEEYSKWEALLGQAGGRSKEELLLDGMERISSVPENQGAVGPGQLIVLNECPTCGNTTLSNSRGNFDVDKPLLESSKCDSLIQGPDGGRRSVIPPRLRRQVLARDQHRCQYPGCGHAGFLQIHHRVPLSQGGQTNLENLVTLCSRCHRLLHAEESELKREGRDPV